jgi:membrane dipeptidase
VVSRRSFLGSLAVIAGAPMVNRGRFGLFAQSSAEYSTRAIDLVRNSTVIDMLGLLTLDYRKLGAWQRQPDSFPDAAFERMKASGTTIIHPAVGFTKGDIYAESFSDLSGWNAFLAAHRNNFLRVEGPADIDRAKASGKIGVLLGLQNSSHFRSVDDVNRFYALGQRVSQLTYTPNRLGGGSTDPRDSGLTDYGVQIVQRMNLLGMAIDVSHCADRTTLDAIETSRKPVLVTHSNCRAIVQGSARCKSDEAIRKLAARGGVMGITMIRFFVSPGGAATIENVLDHIDHVSGVAGIEHVGLGTDVDLDGHDRVQPLARKADLDGVDYTQKIFDVTEGLLRRGYTTEHIEMILGGNFRRALDEIWTTAGSSDIVAG